MCHQRVSRCTKSIGFYSSTSVTWLKIAKLTACLIEFTCTNPVPITHSIAPKKVNEY